MCDEIKSEYWTCLTKSGRNPSKCTDIEKRLRSCGASHKINLCVDETVDLLHCARSPGAEVCAKEFIKMRECNRPGGAEIKIKDGHYITTKEKSTVYVRDSLALSEAPARSIELMKKTIEATKEALANAGFKNLKECHIPAF